MLFSKSTGTKSSQLRTWHFEKCHFKVSLCRKILLQNLIVFFRKISFQTLIFKEKVCYKVMPFKMSTKSGKFVVFCGANWVKTTFFRCEFLIDIWFLNKNWTQKLSFWKNFVSTKRFFEKFFIEIRPDEKLSIQIVINFLEKILVQSLIFFKKFFFKTCFLIF